MNNTASTQGDTISRSALKKALKSESYWTYTHEYGDAIPVGWVMSAIDNAPTVEGYKNVIVGGMNNPYNAGYMDGIRQAYKELERPLWEEVGKTQGVRMMNEIRLIDANALTEYVRKVEDWESAYKICAYIDNAPTVEPSQNAEHDATQYSTGYQDGFLEAKKLFTDPENAAALEKITAEIVSILKDVMPQVVEIAKEYATGNGMKEGQTDE